MQKWIKQANQFFDLTLGLRSRAVGVLSILFLIPIFIFPLWSMTLYSNQFPDGLYLGIYSYKIEGAKSALRDDLKEINSLNHYIGMKPLESKDFSELNWIPFAVGIFVILTLRAVVLGKISNILDIVVMFLYFGGFSLASFYYRMYQYGHHLSPDAPYKVPLFTPPIFGHKTMANFEVFNYPDLATYFMLGFPLLLILALWLSWKNDQKEMIGS